MSEHMSAWKVLDLMSWNFHSNEYVDSNQVSK